MILAIDLGNFNVKTSEGKIFSSCFKVQDLASESFDKAVLSYDGVNYSMDRKDGFELEFNKANKNYIPNLLYAIEQSCSEEVKEVQLILGVPISNMGLKDRFKAELEGKTFTFNMKGKPSRTITIDKLGVLPEGMSSFYALSSAEREKDLLIIDIGGRTVNLASFRGKRVEKKTSLPMGTINLYQNIADRFNLMGNNVDVTEVENFINKGFISKDIYKPCYDEFINSIFNSIKLIANIEHYEKVWITGGGSIALREDLKTKYNKVECIENPIFSNVNGNKKVALAQWNK